MCASLSAPAAPGGYVPRRKRPSVWLLLPVLLLVVLSLLPLAYVGLKTWQAGWAEALHLLWRPYVFGLLRNTLSLMIGVTLACGVIGLSLAWLLERSNLKGRRLWRGGLPPFGCEAVVNPLHAVEFRSAGAASRPNGGKPPRHSPAPTGVLRCCRTQPLIRPNRPDW